MSQMHLDRFFMLHIESLQIRINIFIPLYFFKVGWSHCLCNSEIISIYLSQLHDVWSDAFLLNKMQKSSG